MLSQFDLLQRSRPKLKTPISPLTTISGKKNNSLLVFDLFKSKPVIAYVTNSSICIVKLRKVVSQSINAVHKQTTILLKKNRMSKSDLKKGNDREKIIKGPLRI